MGWQRWEQTSACEAKGAPEKRGTHRSPRDPGQGAPVSLGASRIGGAGKGGSRTQASPEVVASPGLEELGATRRPWGGPPAGPGSRCGNGEAHRGGLRVSQDAPLSYLGKCPRAGRLEAGGAGVGCSAAAICHAVNAIAFIGLHSKEMANSKFISPGRML